MSATTPDQGPPSSPRTIIGRHRLGVAIAALGICAQTAIWFVSGDDQTMLVMRSMMVTPAALFLLALWFFFVADISRDLRRSMFLFLLVAVGLFFTLFRHDGFYGAMIPRFVWRFGKTSEVLAREFHQDQLAGGGVALDSEQLIVTERDWAQFRGPRRDGIARGVKLRTNWKLRPPKRVWRNPIGKGWSSFAVVDGLAFTQEQIDDEEFVSCYRAETGELVWSHADQTRFTSQMGGDGPRATPTIHDSRLYSVGATGILNCLDPLTGKEYWSTNILEDAGAENLNWGMAGSPLVYGNQVLVNPGGAEGRAVISYDRLTGQINWAEGRHAASYCSLRIEELDGQPQILLFDGEGIAGLTVDGGEELWRREWTNAPQVNAAQPINHGGQILISSGYTTGSGLLDVTDIKNGKPTDIWTSPGRFRLKFNDGVYRDGYVYGLDEGILACLDAATGKRLWKRGRYGFGQLLMTEDHLVVLDERGEVVQLEVSPEGATEVGRFQALEGITWNHPVIHAGRLFVRNASEAACFDLE